MKYLISLISFTLFLNADYLYPAENNICVSSVVPFQGNAGVCYTLTSDGLTYCDNSASFNDFIDGYNLVSTDCILKNDLSFTGLTQNQWDYNLALLANLLGFSLIFLLSFLSILIVRK